ncbi:hypothetical protein DM01DRAFT_1083766 [Hesseltinella vesiculosa]|uniref:DH domain-containing protein n=1 Tax=Hesseltinella vesiculosa TaxID=101127 RepID=A0A1X2GE90_9FUNG|nr:hypothetical protein DM01DRAFT_1083766 [Hesseltinella vesiculosa]
MRQFMALLGTPVEPVPCMDLATRAETPPDLMDAAPIHDNDQRQFRMHEFIVTEKTYFESLKAAFSCVVQPLSCATNKHILNAYKCTKIFLNLPRLYQVTEAFLLDLEERTLPFGDICLLHMSRFICYRKYLMEQHDAQQLHAKELRCNTLYKRFIEDARQHPLFKMRKFEDILLEPVQRIGRYAMMLKDIILLTSKDHPDHAGLSQAYKLICDIAIMADDGPTKTVTMFMNMYNAVKDCPCTLVKPNRSLVAFLDAVEVQRDASASSRHVTLFLFTDKIMVVTRPSNQRTEETLRAWHRTMPSLATKRDQPMKFKGWIDINCVEFFYGHQDNVSETFMLHASPLSPASLAKRRSSITSVNYEKYFTKSPHIFSVFPHSSQCTSVEQLRISIDKTKALCKSYAQSSQAYERSWASLNAYANVYTVDHYLSAETKNNIVVLYMENVSDFDLQQLLVSHSPSPWIVALVQADVRGFRFHVCSQIPLRQPVPNRVTPMQDTSQSIDFERVFWNNIVLAERQLRQAPLFSHVHDRVLRSELQKKSRTSVPRPSSIITISKLLQHGISLPLSPVSPKPTECPSQPKSSKSTPMLAYKSELPAFSESMISVCSSNSSVASNFSQSNSGKQKILRRFTSKSSNALSATSKLQSSFRTPSQGILPSPPISPWQSEVPSPAAVATLARRDTRDRSLSFSTAPSALSESSIHAIPPRPRTCSAHDGTKKAGSLHDLQSEQPSHRRPDNLSSINSTRSSSLASLDTMEERCDDAQVIENCKNKAKKKKKRERERERD